MILVKSRTTLTQDCVANDYADTVSGPRIVNDYRDTVSA